MSRLLDGCCRFLEVLIGLALAIMVVLVFGNVVLRYAFNSGITVSEEVSRWLFVCKRLGKSCSAGTALMAADLSWPVSSDVAGARRSRWHAVSVGA